MKTDTIPRSTALPTVAEIRAEMLKLNVLDDQLLRQQLAIEHVGTLADNSAPSDTAFAISQQLEALRAGTAAPAPQRAPVFGDLEAIAIRRTAIAKRQRELGKEHAAAAEREAQAIADAMAPEWTALAREIVLTSTKLFGLEEKARGLAERVSGQPVKGLPLTAHMGFGSSCLGIGEPLAEMQHEALQARIVTHHEIRKASNV